MCTHDRTTPITKKVKREKFDVLICQGCKLMSMAGAGDFWLSPVEPDLLYRLRFLRDTAAERDSRWREMMASDDDDPRWNL